MTESGMILSTAPLRVSLLGGGSDLRAYLRRYRTGACVSFTIDSKVRVMISRRQHSDDVVLQYGVTRLKWDGSDGSLRNMTGEVDNSIFYNVMRSLGIWGTSLASGLEVISQSDVSYQGSGLGASSAFAVALTRGLARLQDRVLTDEEVVGIAAEAEFDAGAGWQDVLAATYGGFNEYVMTESEHTVHELKMHRDWLPCMRMYRLRESSEVRSASAILEHQQELLDSDSAKVELTTRLADLARTFTIHAQNDDADKWLLGALIRKSWDLKRALNPMVSNPKVDGLVDSLTREGALGCKLLGAGGTGYVFAMFADEATAIRATVAVDQLARQFHFEPWDGGGVWNV